MNYLNQPTSRPYLLFWLSIPLLLVWFAASYLLGVARQPVWQDRDTQTGGQVLAAKDQKVIAPIMNPQKDFTWQGTGLVSFWFDDGWLTQYTVAAPILKANNYPGAVAITTDLVGYEAYMSWGQVKRLYHYYQWDVTAHSRTHNCDATTLTPESIQAEIDGSLKDLVNQGIDVDTYVLPCGVQAPEVINHVKQTYVAMRDSGSVLNPLPVTDPYALHAFTIHDNVSLAQIETWLKQAAAEKSWLILMLHQIDNSGGEYGLKPETFQAIVDLVKHSGLPVIGPATGLKITSLSPSP